MNFDSEKINDCVISLPKSEIIFTTGKNGEHEMIRLCENGDIFVKGKLVENDKELVVAMRQYLNLPKGE